MPVQEKPYFLENEEWYTYNIEEGKYELTDKAPQEAVESYNEFYADSVKVEENGEFSIENPDDNDEKQAMSLFGLQGGQNGMR